VRIIASRTSQAGVCWIVKPGGPVVERSSIEFPRTTNTPAGRMGVFARSLPWTSAFPDLTAGQLLRYSLRGLLSIHFRTACILAKSPKATLYTRDFSSFVTSTAAPIATGWSEPVPGRDLPAVDQRLSRARQTQNYLQSVDQLQIILRLTLRFKTATCCRRARTSTAMSVRLWKKTRAAIRGEEEWQHGLHVFNMT